MPRPALLNNLSIPQLQQIIQTRKSEISKLERQRTKLARKLGAIEAKISSLGGFARSRNGARVRNEKSLPEMLLTVLTKSSKPMQVGDITEAVRSGGYKSNSPSFRSIVNQTLIKDKRFASAGRGLYQLKK
jgi:hypothetical protein